MNRRSVLIGTGSALPARVVDNAEMARMVDTSDEWIVERTGIRQRHIAGDGETTASLAIEAARKACDAAGVEGSSVDPVCQRSLGNARQDPCNGCRAPAHDP